MDRIIDFPALDEKTDAYCKSQGYEVLREVEGKSVFAIPYSHICKLFYKRDAWLKENGLL